MSKKIKDEQKKFLGETLNQYDKALDEAINQLDKKNREQNHKISSLVNSFDNEYLEKDVEGNMTTLENSKDGMVIINEIQGNTEVNYCKDGEKELILNGDIDTQGESFVTLTEGVDGGLVDVSLEGNTEVNLSNTKDPVLVTREFDDINCNVGKLQYTIDDVTTVNDEPGKVDIDRIVGDTMVNHAVNGSEELILNAHINESGDNNITLNGVTSDGGKVDVVLEGNTLVNVSKTKDSTALPLDEELTYLYANTQYTVQFVSDKATTVDITLGGTKLLSQSIVRGFNRISITTPDTLVDNKLIIDGVGANISEVVVTDTNREFAYFEGMKSVGECEELEVKSINKNLYNFDWTIINTKNDYGTSNGYFGTIQKLKPNTKYYITVKNDNNIVFDDNYAYAYISGGMYGIIWTVRPNESIYGNNSGEIATDNTGFVYFRASNRGLDFLNKLNQLTFQIEEGKVATDYIPHQSNSQTLTHEPLRAVGNVRDRYVMVDGKWFIERKCGKYVMDGTDDSEWRIHEVSTEQCTTFHIIDKYFVNKMVKKGYVDNYDNRYFMCDKLPISKINHPTFNQLLIENSGSGFVWISLVGNLTIEQGKQWLINNPITIYYALSSSVYEPIDYNPLEVYSDITHISTNSTIPCNMVIKNHGYNLVALKENTQYTLYVNKNTTNALTYRLGDYVEINSPSKFTFTTPSTLTDKTLRIDGKGTKVNDLMLIEGTPTNDSIGYFDGLKSSYECEQVTDENDENYGKYKVDVKVVGKNKFDKNKFINAELCTFNGIECVKVQDTNKYFKYYDNFKYNTQYTLTLKVYREESHIDRYFNVVIEYTDGTEYKVGIKPSQLKTITTDQNKTINYIHGEWMFGGNGYIDLSVAQLEEGNTATEYEPYFESKQTVYLNSPLLKGDEIVWKDNKIQHYHKMETIVLDGSADEGWIKQGDDWDTDNRITFKISLPKSNLQWWVLENEISTAQNRLSKKVSSDKFTYIYNIPNGSINEFMGQDGDIGHFGSSARYLVIGLLKAKLQTQDVTGFKQWLQQNPITVAYELATPYYEEISPYPLKLSTKENCSLTTESNIQVAQISFNIYEETLAYLYPSTKYYVSFNADISREIVVDLGGTKSRFTTQVGYNKIEIITPADTTNMLTFNGQGINIDHVMVTKQDIDEYFEGMKSVGECENNTLEIICKNNDNSKSNTQTLTHEPLRSVGDIKDKYVQIDGKWYIERNLYETKVSRDNGFVIGSLSIDNDNVYIQQSRENLKIPDFYYSSSYLCSNKYKNYQNNYLHGAYQDVIGITWDGYIRLVVSIRKITNIVYDSYDKVEEVISKINEWLNNQDIKIVYRLLTPQYEPIDYNPFEVYSDITHISNNSLIPSNMVIKNHGYNTILKPSTKYTIALNKSDRTIGASLGGSAKVDSTNSIFTITTPSTLNDNVLRLSGSGKVKDIMILEGDKTVNTPSYFEGIESAFEQEYDTEVGKYRVTAKIEGDGKESNITFYINEPLRGVENNKDKVFIQDNKVVVKRNCGSYTFDGNEGWIIEDLRNNTLSCRWLDSKHVLNLCSQLLHCNTLPVTEVYNKDNEGIDIHSHLVMHSRVHISRLQTQDVAGFKQWLQDNPTTIVYQLAEPTYEEVDCDLSKLVLENYENSSLIFESNIPVSANIRYSGEVPVVTQAKSLSSQVDNTTLDINENIIPYMCDIDYRIVELQLMNGDTQGEGIELLGIGDIEILGNENVLFNNREDKKYNYSYDMLKRDILSQRYSKEEYQYRLDRYLLANKISNEEYKELEGLLNNGE